MVDGYWGHEAYSEDVEVQGSLDEAPEGLGIDVCDSNVNEDDMYWCKVYETGEPVLVKDGSAEFGNAPPANLLAYELFSDTEINVPDIGYSSEKDEVYMEVLDSYDGSVSALDGGDKDEFLKHVAGKALIGDSDFMHNIGKTDSGYALIDPDQAGAPLSTFEDDLAGYLSMVRSGTSFDISKNDVEEALQDVSMNVGLEKVEAVLDELEPFTDEIPDYANFEPEFILDNFRAVQGGSKELVGSGRPVV